MLDMRVFCRGSIANLLFLLQAVLALVGLIALAIATRGHQTRLTFALSHPAALIRQ